MVRTIIDNNRKQFFSFIEILQYKDLLYTLAWREFRIRYAQTFLGFLWVLIQPLATLAIFFVIFGKAIKVDTGDIPYPVFALTGITAWSFFSFVVATSGRSLITESAMIKKIYFPRLIIPLSKAFVGLIDFFVGFVLLILSMIYFHVTPSSNLIWLPVFVFFLFLISLGAGIWISALSIRFRDVQHIIPFLIQIGLYATPIAYSVNIIPEKYHLIYYLVNPLTPVIEGFRWCITGGSLNINYVIISFTIITLFVLTSLLYFRKVEQTMADIL